MVEIQNNRFIIDVGPDFRQQMLRENISHINGILLTHAHKDHTAGIDDLRAFNYLQKAPVNVYAEKRVIESVKREYEYVFAENRYPGVPELNLIEISKQEFSVNGINIIPIRAYHNKLPILGFRFGNVAYLTDVKTIPEEEFTKLNNIDVLILSVIRPEPHIAHLGLNEALELIERIKPTKAFFTHISHVLYPQSEIKKYVPLFVDSAYDGLTIEL